MNIPIGGFQKQSLIDYPGNIASVLFLQGCNFRCVYCHNPELVYPKLIKQSFRFNTKDVMNWIDNNKHLLDAVVITGGEPTMHCSLPCFIEQFKKTALKVKLDTNGTNPEMLKRLISNKMVDYIAMDIKAPLVLEEYQKIAGTEFMPDLLHKIQSSVEIIMKSGVNYEFRITVVEPYHTPLTIEQIAQAISGQLILQQYKHHPGNTKDTLKPFSELASFNGKKIGSTIVKLRPD